MNETPALTAKQRRRMAGQRRRTHNVLLAFVFLLFLLVCFFINLCVKDREFSDTENRSLAQKPALTWASISDGSYFSGLTTHFSDQFFARDGWISMKLWEDSLLGRKDSGGVFLCENDYLMAPPEAADQDAIAASSSAINQFAARYPDADMRIMVVPEAASILPEYLPSNAPVRDQLQDINEYLSLLDSSVTRLDAVSPLTAAKDREIYYKTDHHWTSLGAYTTFCYNSTAMGITGAVQEYDVYTVTNSFEGTLSSKSGSHAVQDHIEIYAPKNSSVEYYVTYPDSSEKVCSVYRSDCLEAKDKYTVFFGGNHSIIEIKTTANNDKNLLLFKDSYANCFVPFLLSYYESITIIDPRYYYDNVDLIMKNSGITDVLFLYCGDTILTDTSLADVLAVSATQETAVSQVATAPTFGSVPANTTEDSSVEESILEGPLEPSEAETSVAETVPAQ